ncbi:hypothetical protein D039_0446B, partial [Vibrio parahaemolyticus EKP-028]
ACLFTQFEIKLVRKQHHAFFVLIREYNNR